jgi:hypothetical protein
VFASLNASDDLSPDNRSVFSAGNQSAPICVGEAEKTCCCEKVSTKMAAEDRGGFVPALKRNSQSQFLSASLLHMFSCHVA